MSTGSAPGTTPNSAWTRCRWEAAPPRSCNPSRTTRLRRPVGAFVRHALTQGSLVMEFNLADLFEQVADAVPDRPAVYCGGRTLTFAELDRRANRLAHHFASAGIG